MNRPHSNIYILVDEDLYYSRSLSEEDIKYFRETNQGRLPLNF